MSNKIRWGCVQPLTGGMYLGTEKAVGHPAEWIISYPGLTDFVKDKEGNIIDAGNERNIVDYLIKVNRMPAYYTMNRTMTQNDEDLNPVLKQVYFDNFGHEVKPVSEDLYNNMDLVIGVPVCAGLSMASTASAERKSECNCQMEWMAKYVLNTIKPKVYVFENAPTLMSERGDSVREILEKIAEDAGYTVVYYKTDTKYHHNCQKRPRTFIYFFKHKNSEPFVPKFNYLHDTIGVKEFFAEMTNQNNYRTADNDPMTETIATECCVNIPLAFVNHYYGKDWRTKIDVTDIFYPVLTNTNGEREAFISWVKENYDEKTVAWFIKYINHFDDKRSQGKGIWAVTAKYFNNDCLPACMYKNVPVVIHHEEDRLYNMREWLWAMGHPVDFDMVGLPWNYFRKIGQNVPANTANWIATEAIRIIENWDNEPTDARMTNNDLFEGATISNVAFYDNTKQKRVY